MIKIYTTGCPNCNILERKLFEKGIYFEEETDVKKMVDLGFETVPMLDVDGNIMDYKEALEWVSNM